MLPLAPTLVESERERERVRERKKKREPHMERERFARMHDGTVGLVVVRDRVPFPVNKDGPGQDTELLPRGSKDRN